MKKIIIYSCLSLIVFVSCKNENKNVQNAYKAVDKAEAENQKLDSISQVGNKTFGEFTKAFIDKKPGTTNFFVKEKFVANTGQEEHLWISDITSKNDTLYGVVNSQPKVTNEVKLNDTIKIDPSKITDWMFYRNDTLIGGYSVKYERSKLSDVEKKKFDEQYGVTIPD